MNTLLKPVARDQRPAGLAAQRQRLAHHRGRQRRGALARIDVQRREQQRIEQPVVKRPRAIEHVAHRGVVRHPEERARRFR